MMRFIVLALLILAVPSPALAQSEQTPPLDRSRDRGDGVPSSMFGTYIKRGEFLFYPYFEYYRDNNYEYEAGELGFVGTTELRSRFRAREGLLFFGYGITDNLAVEFEAARTSAWLDKSPFDTSLMPARLREAGLGDVEGQLRWRWKRETDTRPEFFSYVETVLPLQRSRRLIGTRDWEFAFGTGMTRGLSWGTITLRASLANVGGTFEPGEYAFSYLKRLSTRFRVFASIEGSEDEVEAISEMQVFLTKNIFLKLNNAFGVTPKAPDWAPEIGVMFVFP